MRPPNLLHANRREKNRHFQQRNRSPASSQSSLLTSSNNAPVLQRSATTLPTSSGNLISRNGMPNNEHSASLPPIPPSFGELDHERSYLLNCLQHENFKATELMRKITPLEEDLINGNLPSAGNVLSTKRKVRNQLGWFKNRLEQTARQERSILARLGQLTFQIQKRVRATQIEDEYREFEALRRDGLLNNYNSNMLPMQQMPPNFGPCYPTQYAPNQILPPVPEWQQQQGDYSWQQSTPEDPSEDPHSEEISPKDTSRHDSIDRKSVV